MFENLLGQDAAGQLIADIRAAALAPAMLFSGPAASGKGTAALELGRVISCEAPTESGSWNCACSACARHRLLLHPDLLCLGPRPFSAEIAASAGTFLRETENQAGRLLFVRSIRKLLLRFSPVLMEDEPKLKSFAGLINSLEEDLDELEQAGGTKALVEGILKNAFKLESEGIGESIPIAQIRRAAYWGRLAPAGRAKLLVIENADCMQEEARNSLLKLLEEPPQRLNCLVTSSRPQALLPTMLSRLRPYRFSARDAATESQVIRRVFKDEGAGNSEQVTEHKSISAYLDSFLPVSPAALEALAAFFAASLAYKAVLLAKKAGRPPGEELLLLGKHCAPQAEAAGLGRPQPNPAPVISVLLEKTEKFEIRSLFSRFLSCLLQQVSQSLKQAPSAFLPSVAYNEAWRKSSQWADTAVSVYKLKTTQVLEKLFSDLSKGLSEAEL
ncbi:MAG: DNA polymerase III [Treponema sp.]|nr:DNA polymerase III [Treponema sp.]